MKTMKKRARGAIAILVTLGLALAVPAPSLAVDEPDDSSLVFDADSAYQGRFTVDDLTFDTYQVTYVQDPIPEFVDHFKLNIKVPVSYDGVDFDPDAVAEAPILATNPWGGDRGAVVPEADVIGAGNTQTMRTAWMRQGNVAVELGMRGREQTSGGISYGKLPEPIVDMKAALRYLHFNEDLIPGDAQKIFFSGYSSGGDGTVMIGSSGNTTLYDSYLEEIGAAPATDDVFGVIPGAPVMARNVFSDARIWQLMYDQSKTAEENITDLKATNTVNGMMLEHFIGWLDDKGIEATVDGVPGTPITPDTLDDYMLPYLEDSADRAGNTTWDRGWDSFWTGFSGNSADERDPAIDGPFEADDFTAASVTTDGVMTGGSRSQGSFGAPTASASVFTEVGLEWIQTLKPNPVTVSQDAEDLLEFQRNSTDPFYFILGENVADGDAATDVAPNWFIRHGAADAPVTIGLSALLNATLESEGYTSDLVYNWNVGHSGSTVFNAEASEELLAWAGDRVAEYEEKVVDVVPAASVEAMPGNRNQLTVTVTEVNYFGDEQELVEEFSIRNNASGVYEVGPYSVFVDTKGNDQVREVHIVE